MRKDRTQSPVLSTLTLLTEVLLIYIVFLMLGLGMYTIASHGMQCDKYSCSGATEWMYYNVPQSLGFLLLGTGIGGGILVYRIVSGSDKQSVRETNSDHSFDVLIREHEDYLQLIEANTCPEAVILRQESEKLLGQLRLLPDEIKLKTQIPKIKDLHVRSREVIESVRELSEG